MLAQTSLIIQTRYAWKLRHPVLRSVINHVHGERGVIFILRFPLIITFPLSIPFNNSLFSFCPIQ